MRAIRSLLPFLMLAGCGGEPAGEQERFAPVVVYAAYDDEEYLSDLFEGFTKQTRIPVTVRSGEAGKLVDDVIANRGSPPADILLTTNAADAWRAADEGALRPISAGNMANVAGFLRDPDNLWTAARMSVVVVATNPEATLEPPTNYADLGKPVYSGSLCLSSSSLPTNRSLLAMLIAEFGVKQAERVVRGWVRNLASPVFETEAELLDAVNAGTCAYAIVPGSLASDGYVVPGPAYVDIEGIGIARHARYPDSAAKLVDWILSEDVQVRHARVMNSHPVLTNLIDSPLLEEISGKNVGMAGWHDNDAVLLAERAGYR